MAANSPQQPELKAGEVGNRRIDPGAVELTTLHFDRLFGASAPSGPEGDDPDANITFELRAGRVAAEAVLVSLSVTVQADPVAAIKVAARTTLTVTSLEDADPVTAEEFAQISARMGPVIIYPYLREVVADVTRRAGLEPLTLPIYQIGSFFTVDPKDLALPKPPKAAKKPAKKATKKSAKATPKKTKTAT